MFDIEAVRAQFPILQEHVHGRPLVYLDNAATAQMPQRVIDAIAAHYRHDNANVHRGSHELSARSTRALERARETVAAFIGAPSSDCVAFTGGTTGSLNALASFAEKELLKPDSTVLATLLEHHSNYLPWMHAAETEGARFETVGLTEEGGLDYAALEQRLSRGDVAVLACTQMSNITGEAVDIRRVVRAAHAHGVPVVVDAAQSAAHMRIDVGELGCDFLALSGHKLGSLTGIGVLYAAPSWLDRMGPYQLGGGMVSEVSLAGASFEPMPLVLEAGTPNYVGAISLAEALDFICGLDREAAYAHEAALARRMRAQLASLPDVRVLGSGEDAPVVSVDAAGVAPLDLATYLNLNGIAARAGTGCAQPLLNEGFGVRAVTRFSLSCINTEREVDFACAKVADALEMLRGR